MDRLEEYRAMIERELACCLKNRGEVSDGLLEAERYSLLAGGKRIRPVLVLEFNRICGGNIVSALPVACAVEMLHTYSLIHDDLPCMDDDDLRRGRPTSHKAFGECTAVLAGDALQADAFSMILESKLPAERRAECARILAKAAGSAGMCSGQFLDTKSEVLGRLDEAKLKLIYSRKTGALITAACLMGAVSAGADSERLAAARGFGDAVGLAFQIRDDILDMCASDKELGKSAGSDERGGKTTLASLLGAENAQQLLVGLTETAKQSLAIFEDSDFLTQLADALKTRKS